MNYLIEHPSKLVKGKVSLPASKSLSNRALIIQALCKEAFSISNLSKAKDTKVLKEALKNSSNKINIDDAGTSMRFLTAFFSIQKKEVVLKGSERMHDRPIAPLVEALNSLGANISYLEKEGYPPLHIQKGNIQGGTIQVNSTVSSQFISALLLIAPTVSGGLTINLQGNLVSKSYIETTLKMMSYFGIESNWSSQKIQIKEQQYQAKNICIENDWSAVTFWLEIVALAEKAQIELNGLYRDSWQGDIKALSIFLKLGVNYQFKNNHLILFKEPKQTPKIQLNVIETPDLAQAICCTYAGLQQQLEITGLSTLKIKETNRISALHSELGKLGINTKISQDSILIKDFNKHIGIPIIKTHQDHRMAMSFAPLTLCFGKLIIENIDVVKKSYPTFWEELEKVGFTIAPATDSNN
tara:strand:+ start:2551 stop:3786 length:1236 start_codon:yes stop_codon:yes gene_type:complete